MGENDKLSIRTAQRADAPAIYAIHRASLMTLCATHYSREQLQCVFANKTVEGYYEAIDRAEMFVCERDSQIAGFGHAIPGEVVAVFVRPDVVRQGIGSKLLNHAIQCARYEHTGPVKVIATLNAQSFYEHRGFLEISRYALLCGDINFPVVEMAFP
jgi:GNAT superfamily N-acetyltransferase